MKLIATLIATLFAVSAFAAEPAKKEEAKPAAPAASAPAKAEAKKEVKPTKSEPAKKDAKATTEAAKTAAPAAK
jgi:hypothetical protein